MAADSVSPAGAKTGRQKFDEEQDIGGLEASAHKLFSNLLIN